MLGHASLHLRRHCHKAPFIGILDLVQNGAAELALVDTSGNVNTGMFRAVSAANGAAASAGTARNTDLLLDTALDLPDEVGIGSGAHHIGIGTQRQIRSAVTGLFLRIRHELCVKDPGCLRTGAQVVVKDAGLSDKERFELAERLLREAFQIPVNVIVAQRHIKEIHLIRRVRAAGEAVELFECIHRKNLLAAVRR